MTDELLVFDGDDTLWRVEPLYDEARNFARDFVASLGLDSVRWEALQRVIDVENVRSMGLHPRRFPTSCVEAYERLAHETDPVPKEAAKQIIRDLASSVFRRPAPLVAGAERVLRELSLEFRLVLLTRGHESVQRKRIEDSGLGAYFEATFIVPQKDAAVFREVLEEVSGSPKRSWSIGNSLPSDIYPALESGMAAAWVDAHVWEYERRPVEEVAGRLIVAESLEDLPSLLKDSVQITHG
jgi:putative hydrolase of the HAD superfamily